MGKSRSELREKIMTVLYQINMYKANKIKYSVDDILKEVLNAYEFFRIKKVETELVILNEEKYF